MANEIKMPALSPTMTEGRLSRWLVKVGDELRSGDLIAEIETDKATMEVEAVDEGIVIELLVDEGAENVAVGTVIARLDGDDAETAPLNNETPAPIVVSEPAPVSASRTIYFIYCK